MAPRQHPPVVVPTRTKKASKPGPLHIPRTAKAPPKLPPIGSETIPIERHAPGCWCNGCMSRRLGRREPLERDLSGQGAASLGPEPTQTSGLEVEDVVARDAKSEPLHGPLDDSLRDSLLHAEACSCSACVARRGVPVDRFREKVEACTNAIAELASYLLSSTRPNRFTEASRVALLARQLVISTASRAKDLPLQGLGAALAYPVPGGAGVVDEPIFGDNEGARPAVGARNHWADALGGPAGFQNPNDAGINQREAMLAVVTSMQAQGDQARANARRAIAGEVADLTRLREELAEGIWKMTQDPQRAAAPADAPKLAEDRRRLEVIDKRIDRLFDQIAADEVPEKNAPFPTLPGDLR